MDPQQKKNKQQLQTECLNFVKKIEQYATTDFKNQFENSVSSSPHYFSYSTTKVPGLNLPYTPSFDLSKIKLSLQFE
jgi:hypothetical protein